MEKQTQYCVYLGEQLF